MTPTAPAFTQTLRQLGLLLPEQFAELPALETNLPEAGLLAEELQRRGWLSTYQLDCLTRGEGASLVLGSYVVLDKLGEGGMGAVFKARHRSLGRVVAVKVIRQDRLTHPSAVKRFQREVRALAQLSHPNIILAYDADCVGDVHFLVLEYVDGIDLGKLVQQRGPLPIGDACDAVRQAALGLQHAHERGLVHRDIKPANLLRCHRDGVVKLLDLGLVRLLQTEGEQNTGSILTYKGAVMGTIDYMPPEQLRDAHSADIRSDLYALGCTLFYLLSGRIPFPGRNPSEKLYAHCFTEAPLVNTIRPDVPQELTALISRLMSKKPEDRCQTPAELAALLAVPMTSSVQPALTNTIPTLPQFETTPGVRLPEPLSKRLLWVLGGSLLLVILLLMLLNRPQPKPETPAPPSPTPVSKDGDKPSPPPPLARPANAVAPFDIDRATRLVNNWARYLNRRVDETNSIGMRFRLIPPGEFDQGATAEELRPTILGLAQGEGGGLLPAVPKHRVRLSRPYYLGEREVTVGQFRAFVNDTQYRTRAEWSGNGSMAWDHLTSRWVENPRRIWSDPGWKQTDDHPVSCLCWYDAAAFCTWLSRKEKRTYRLPTEAEWEYACRAGTTTAFHVGEQLGPDQAIFHRMGNGEPEPGATRQANAFGLLDMHGNVMEWCSDWFAPYPREAQSDPRGPLTGRERVMRGGAYDMRRHRCRSDFRHHRPPAHRSTITGFRVWCEVPDDKTPTTQDFVALFDGKNEAEWTTNFNPDNIKERFTSVTEDGEPALRSPGTGRLRLKGPGQSHEYYHLRLEAKLGESRSLDVAVQDGNGSSLGIVLGAQPAQLFLRTWGEYRFDEATLRNGQIEVRNKGLKELPLTATALKAPEQWQLIEVFGLAEQTVFRINGQIVGVSANLRAVKPDGKEVLASNGGIVLGVGKGVGWFRRIEVRPIQGLPIDLADGP